MSGFDQCPNTIAFILDDTVLIPDSYVRALRPMSTPNLCTRTVSKHATTPLFSPVRPQASAPLSKTRPALQPLEEGKQSTRRNSTPSANAAEHWHPSAPCYPGPKIHALSAKHHAAYPEPAAVPGMPPSQKAAEHQPLPGLPQSSSLPQTHRYRHCPS
jgi:hypothetical protein